MVKRYLEREGRREGERERERVGLSTELVQAKVASSKTRVKLRPSLTGEESFGRADTEP